MGKEMTPDPFVRVVGKSHTTAHVAKDRFPNESLCGRVLDPTPVKTSKGRAKCQACQHSLNRPIEVKS